MGTFTTRLPRMLAMLALTAAAAGCATPPAETSLYRLRKLVPDGGPAFTVSNGTVTAPSRFIFASRDGSISGWAPSVNLNNAIRVVDNSASGALYTGLAVGAGGNGSLLYAADFRNAKIDVFNGAFAAVSLPGTPFRDPRIPAGYAPYGLQAINGDIYVSYARQNATRDAADTGHGLGYTGSAQEAQRNDMPKRSVRGIQLPW